MSKLRGQGRLFVIIAGVAVAVYVVYTITKSSTTSPSLKSQDSAVQNYRALVGRVEVEKVPQPKGKDHGVAMNDNSAGDYLRKDSHGQEHSFGEYVTKVENKADAAAGDIDVHVPVGAQVKEETRELDKAANVNKHTHWQEESVNARHGRKFSPFASEDEPFDLYSVKDTKFSEFFGGLQRIVHLDLKGAQPKLSYLEEVIPMFRKLGATGLLIEYEDTFPYNEKLAVLRARNSYSDEDINHILFLAKENGLSVIPLVQTFGHMEFVLKGKTYQRMRELNSPQVILPTEKAGLLVIREMIDQVVKLHPDSKFLHIGSDEVYQLGEGYSKKILEDNGWTKTDLFFSHVSSVAKMVKSLGRQPIMWDDMFRTLNETVLEKSELGSLVQPMVWQYLPRPQNRLPSDIWAKYGKVFKNVWIASSFKGATGSAQYVTDVSYHLENHLNWIEIMKYYGAGESGIVNFMGAALTGWQRYDHFATLCEMLPAAIPSVAVCLQTLKNGYFDEELHSIISKKFLGCQKVLELRLDVKRNMSIPDQSNCTFPGSQFYYDVHTLYDIQHKFGLQSPNVISRLDGWLSSYNIKHNFTSTGQLGVFIRLLNKGLSKLQQLRGQLAKSLEPMFDKHTIAEFLDVQVDSPVEKMKKYLELAKMLSQRKVWPRRPLFGDEQDDAIETLMFYKKYDNGGNDKAPLEENRVPVGEHKSRVRGGINPQNNIPVDQAESRVVGGQQLPGQANPNDGRVGFNQAGKLILNGRPNIKQLPQGNQQADPQNRGMHVGVPQDNNGAAQDHQDPPNYHGIAVNKDGALHVPSHGSQVKSGLHQAVNQLNKPGSMLGVPPNGLNAEDIHVPNDVQQQFRKVFQKDLLQQRRDTDTQQVKPEGLGKP